jgi:integrase
MTRFTQQGVTRIKAPPKPKRRDIIHTLDGGGRALALRVSYQGSKAWRVLYYVNGKPRTKTLGKFPKMSVKEAYEEARKFEVESKKVEAGTFQQVAEDFISSYVDAEGLRWKPEIERVLKKYIYPKWRDRKFVQIGRSDVATLRDEVKKQHGKRQANVVLAIISKLCNWYAANRSDTYVSPIVRGMAFKTVSRERILSDNELRAVWNAGEGTFGDIVKLLLLTAQRSGKVGTMKWADLKDGVWSMPREPREKSNPGVLKLPQAAIDIIEARDQVAENPFVFPGRVKGQAFNSYSQGKAELDAKLPADMPGWTLHDLRRTARSLMSRAGITSHIAERVLGHTIKGVEGTYDRHGYDPEKAHALEALAGLVERIVNPPDGENIVPIKSVKAQR